MIESLVERVIRNIIRAYRLFEEISGRDIPKDILKSVLDETEHIAIHELAHGVMYTIYPEIDIIKEENKSLCECIDEIAGRFLERYVSSKIGTHVHSFEEHLHELRSYTSLSRINISVEELEELYKQFIKLIRRKELKRAVNVVIVKCREWIISRGIERSYHG